MGATTGATKAVPGHLKELPDGLDSPPVCDPLDCP
jgi:hypothetical protein